jgi:predicted MarR family transcription regulator
LASGKLPVLSEFEFGLILVSHAFHRWMVRGMAAAGLPDLSPIDIMVLHSVQHRSRPKRMADICLVLNIEDTHVVSYSIKKLERLKLISSHRQGKEKLVSSTAAGTKACEKYKAIREALLVEPVASLGLDEATLSRIAGQMRTLSGYYDQAARAAASL